MTLPSITSTTPQQPRHIHILLINPNATPSMTQACLRSLEPTLPPHVTVHGFTAPRSSGAPSAIEGQVDGVLSAAACFRALLPFLGIHQSEPKSGVANQKQQDNDLNTTTILENGIEASGAGAGGDITSSSTQVSSSLSSNSQLPKIDAYLIACFSAHPLISVLRESTTAPVIGIMEAALYASRMLGARLGIVATGLRSKYSHEDAIRSYGLSGHSVGAESTGLGVLELETGEKDMVLGKVAEAARTLVGRGADCVTLGCAGMTEMRRAVEDAVKGPDGEEELVRVVDGVGVGVQFLVGLVRENLGTAKGGLWRDAGVGRAARGQDWI